MNADVAIDPTIQDWQRQRREIGMIQFSSAKEAAALFPHQVPSGLMAIGCLEAELLCIDTKSGEVILLEHEVAGRIAGRCAASQAHFVAALRILEEYFSRCVGADQVCGDEAVGLEVIRRATDAAGGSRYEATYHQLVGF